VVKLWFLCTRRAELSHAQYAQHLLERHAPLALRHHASLRGYALNLVEERGEGAEPIDSLNVLEYDALADFETLNYDSPEGERIVTEDHARFLGAASGYQAAELAAHGAPSRGTKWICALQRRPRLSAERFAAALVADLLPEVLAGQPFASRVALDRVERKLFPGEAPDWDAFYQVSFADPARAPAHPFDSPDCAVTLRRRVAALCEATAVWRVVEQVMLAR